MLESSNLEASLVSLLTPLKPFNPFESSCLDMFKLHSPNGYSSFEGEQSSDEELFFYNHILFSLAMD